MRRSWIFGVVLGVMGCSTQPVSVSPAVGPRGPASLCELEIQQREVAERVLRNPKAFPRVIYANLRAIVQGYLLGEELKDEFDELLAKGYGPEVLFTSKTYSRLQALKSIMTSLRQGLEDIYALKMEQALQSNVDGQSRAELISKGVDQIGEHLRKMMGSGEDSTFRRAALFDLNHDLNLMKRYFISDCDPKLLTLEPEMGEIEGRRDLLERLRTENVKRVRGHYHRFDPGKLDSHGINVAKLVSEQSGTLRQELRELYGPNRSPQTATVRPDPGPAGNITGNGFPAGTWALTFDDGPVGNLTPKVLANLKSHNIQATFFVLSQQILPNLFPTVVKSELAEGHAVESHSFSHPQMPKLGPEARSKEINGAVSILEQVIGQKVRFFRLPYGAGVSVPSIRQKLADAGLIHVFWNVDTLDWQDKNPETIYQRALKQMTQLGRGVILFHDIHPQSVTASEMLMAYLSDPARHLETVTIPQIVDRINGNPIK